VKVCSYAPWALKVCVNGHEWAKRQLDKRGIAYEALDNGFLLCADPAALQEEPCREPHVICFQKLGLFLQTRTRSDD